MDDWPLRGAIVVYQDACFFAEPDGPSVRLYADAAMTQYCARALSRALRPATAAEADAFLKEQITRHALQMLMVDASCENKQPVT